MDRIAAINVFVHVANARSFVDAGRMLGLSASAVGKSVARLEQQLGVRLFHRSTRSVTPTPEGMLFLDRARRILDEMEQAALEMRRNAKVPHGLLRISLPMTADLFAPIIAAFCRHNPDVLIDMDFDNRPVDLIDEGFDLAIRTGRIADTRLMTKHLASFRMMLVASPAYLRDHGVPADPADLSGHRCLRMRMPQSGRLQPWLLDGGIDALDGIPPAAICNDLAASLWLARDGRGIAYVPEFAVAGRIADDGLVVLMEARTTAREAFQALWPSGRLATPKVRAFVDFVGKRLKAALAVTASAASRS